jgi:ribonuclease HI
MPYYAVRNGHHPGVFLTWSECEKQVKGFPGAIYKKFSTKSEATDFLQDSGRSGAKTPRQKQEPEPEVAIPEGAVLVFTDGACQNQGANPKSTWKAGYGYYIPSLNKRCCGPIPPPLTNNRAELTAIILAVQELPRGSHVCVVTDSKYALLIFGGTGARYRAGGYKVKGEPVKNADLVEKAMLLSDEYKLSLAHVRGHTGQKDRFSAGNDIADGLAVKGCDLAEHEVQHG